jgi:hypothetical protein
MDVLKTKLVVENLDLLCDLELNFALPCILPMLEMGHTLITYTQRQDVFICDFFDTMKLGEIKYIGCMPILFVSTRILLSLTLLLFVSIIVDNCPSFGLHMKIRQFVIACQFGILYW